MSPPASGALALVYRRIPALDSLRRYGVEQARADFVAGFSVAAVAVPQAMAYALIAGLPAQYGLYTAIVMTAAGALLDSSRQLINGPTNAISIALLSAIGSIPEPQVRVQAAVLMSLLVGGIQLVISLLRLGDLTRYISHSVIVGFTAGASLLLVLDQMKNLLGLKAVGSAHDHFLVRFWRTMTEGGAVHGPTLVIGFASIAFVLVLRWLKARLGWKLLPEFLIAVIVAASVTAWLGLDKQGVTVVGDIPATLPGFRLPDFDAVHIREYSTSALAIALLGLLEAISMAKAIAAVTRQKLDINQQCLSEGLANLIGSFFQCYPGSGSLTRSTINQQAGGRTQWSGVISAVAVALTVVLFAPFAYYIPRAGLAGILMLSAWRLVDREQLSYYVRTTRFDRWIVILTAVSAVAVSVEFCVLIGVLMSFILYVPQAARVRITELILTPERVIRERGPGDDPCGRIRIYSLEGEFFFGAAPELESHLDAIASDSGSDVRVIILRLKRVRNPDAVCMSVLDRFIDQMQTAHVTVLLCGVRPDLMRVVESSGLVRLLGPDRVFVFQETDQFWTSTLEAVRFAYDILGGDVCETCPRQTESFAEKDGWYYLI